MPGFDVIVAGGGSAGITAALAARSTGATVEVEQHRYRVLGWDPCSVFPGRIHVVDVQTRSHHSLVIREPAA